ncbi:hypothetical protein [Pontibacterium granulatum]|uniref:hypothetical protein n=1 Tax=Pontibacterium granulatum TaxID=2036029 RepID=UPI00249C97EF|nr:hypothetical protein [Pontibacterium granulatum]
MRVSVIIPVGPAESPDAPLFARLNLLPSSWQVIIALCPESESLKTMLDLPRHAEMIVAPTGRAQQMNAAAEKAQGQYLWFLHVDSVLTCAVVQALEQVLAQSPDTLLCYRLRFAGDGQGPVGMNALGANLRTRVLGVPFGDQGFCLPVKRFREVGGYPEAIPYGEDHVLVWLLRLQGVGAHMLPCDLETSARKYRSAGWLSLTLRYQWYWLRQAAPYAGCLLVRRLKRLIRL